MMAKKVVYAAFEGRLTQLIRLYRNDVLVGCYKDGKWFMPRLGNPVNIDIDWAERTGKRLKNGERTLVIRSWRRAIKLLGELPRVR